MYLKSVLVRFYRSFNFDYLRKYNADVTKKYPWEDLDGAWYPFVKIPLDHEITTIVGANESGKSHLLSAIEKGLTGDHLEKGDFCRYSEFFVVEGEMRWPEFGFEWTDLADADRQALATACGLKVTLAIDHFYLFRTGQTTLTAYVPTEDGQYQAHPVDDITALQVVLPTVFRLHEKVGLPETVPIRYLAGDDVEPGILEAMPRAERVDILDGLAARLGDFHTKETVIQAADTLAKQFGKIGADRKNKKGSKLNALAEQELKLARDLLRRIANVGPDALKELHAAIRDGRDAFANSIIDGINDALAKHLNFPKWWVQDREFRLLVTSRDHDLAFTILDRTGTEYGFGERSSGLRYFLSYYIQYRVHEAPPSGWEILLMDEPDAYLSNQGQQDLMKIFAAFARPDDGSRPVQVIYVTHSPFLIDKNHGERLRVLEKGVGDEGTRVVRDVARNHYEPLRSAFGSFVGETTFIGNCNLVLEGPSDQILLAGAATHLRSKGLTELETLDLNTITLVPAGSASHVPYLVFLARGRDIEKPAVVVLLDSDKSGNDAKKLLNKGGPRRKQLLKPEYIVQLGDFEGKGWREPEDLIPLPVCLEAVARYQSEVADERVNPADLEKALPSLSTEPPDGTFDRLAAALATVLPDSHLDKSGFARAVVAVVSDWRRSSNDQEQLAVRTYEDNFVTLFRKLRAVQRAAERELTDEKVSSRINRVKASFLLDHPSSARREHAVVLCETLEGLLDETDESDKIRFELQSIRRDFGLNEEPSQEVAEYQQFRERLERMRYAPRIDKQAATLQERATLVSGAEAIADSAPLDSSS